MTKLLTIDTAAPWAGTVTTITNGDPASEATIDAVMDSIADRLGYLKTRAEDSLRLVSGSAQALTGAGSIDFSRPLNLNALVAINGALGMVVNSGSGASFAAGALLAVDGLLNLTGALAAEYQVLPDANASLSMAYFEHRVPALTAARIYTLPNVASLPFGAGPRYRLRVSKLDISTNHQANIIDPIGVNMITLGAGPDRRGWAEFVTSATGEWRVSAWGGDTSSFSSRV